jgi:hypothetical protein
MYFWFLNHVRLLDFSIYLSISAIQRFSFHQTQQRLHTQQHLYINSAFTPNHPFVLLKSETITNMHLSSFIVLALGSISLVTALPVPGQEAATIQRRMAPKKPILPVTLLYIITLTKAKYWSFFSIFTNLELIVIYSLSSSFINSFVFNISSMLSF